MNSRNIPHKLEQEIRIRDTLCIYCGIVFDNTNKKSQATWEHIINDETIITKENIALCCGSCNASKGAKGLIQIIVKGKTLVKKQFLML